MPLDSSRASHHNSIPHLELVAAEKSVELRQFVETALKMDFDRVVMWTDSECVLKQIFNNSTRFKAFFANRLSKIHAATRSEEWRYVDSKSNLADNASRRINANKSQKWQEFHSGPAFLHESEEMWPKMKSYAQEDLHDHHISITATAIQEAVRPPRGETPGTGFLIAIAKVEFWHQKVKRVVCIRKIISFWRTYKRNRRATRSTSASLSIN